MPQRRTPKSLRTISEWKIIQNLSIYSTEELQNLPNNISEELMDLYTEEFLHNKYKDKMEYCLRFIYRNRLIKPNMKKLNLRFPDHCKLFFQETLGMVLKTCKNLTHFSCDFTKQSRMNLHQLVISMPNVIELKLNIGKPEEKYKDLEYDDDDIFEAIGNNCFQLEILHLTNSRVTTRGVVRFCRSNSQGGRIKELNIDKSRVEINGCLTALRNLKRLRRFSYDYDYGSDQVLEAFKKLFQEPNDSAISTFQLCELPALSSNNIPIGFLSFVTKCCPNVRSLYLEVGDNFDRHVKDLKSCNVNVGFRLDVENVDNFMENLGNVGCRVTELYLSTCDVHIPTIGSTCPNLTDLLLSKVTYTQVHYVAGNNSAYSKLLHLNLSSQNSVPIPAEQLQFLLKNCLELQTLKIEGNGEFTNDVMIQILHGVNPLRHLTEFGLGSCDAVTVAPILELLTMENDLETLGISNCQNIPSLQIDSFIKENNFNVSLETVL